MGHPFQMLTPQLAAAIIESSTSAKLLFGPNPELMYKRLATLVHPDRATLELGKERADRAFAKLSSLYASLNGKPANPVIIGDWIVEGPLAKGDICDLHLVTDKKTRSVKAVLKKARVPEDNDLVSAEASSLKILGSGLSVSKPEYCKYLPTLLNSFEISDCQTNVLSRAEGFYSLADIKAIYPSGLDFRHCVWMMNRLLSVLGYIHRRDVCHGAVLPQHLLYNPETHGLCLVDWCYSVKLGETIKARVKTHVIDYYPPEVGRKLPTSPATDIFMAAGVILCLAALPLPRRFRALFDHCLAASLKARPQDAWEALDRWLELAKEEYGPPSYLKLDLRVM